MNINMGGMTKNNSSVNIHTAPQSANTSGLVSINSSQTAKAALTILRSLTNGEAFSANITDVKGQLVTITLDGGQSFTASILNNMAYNIGDRAQFLLQNNQGDSIVLKALPMNETAFETNIINQSLEAAGLSSTGRNREMVLELMHNNMPISKDALNEMVRELTANPEIPIKDMIALKRMGLELTKDNLGAFVNYKNYNGALNSDINALTESINSAVNDVKSFQEIITLLDRQEGMGTRSLDSPQSENPKYAEDINGIRDILDSLEKLIDNTKSATGHRLEKVADYIKELQNTENKSFNNYLSDLAKIVSELENEPLLKKKMHEFVKGDRMQKLIADLVRDTFSMKTSDLKDSEGVKEHIARSIIKLNEISDYAQANGNKTLADSSSNMNSNMEFLNNMNQFVALAQVPLHKLGDNGEGELYVYRRKKAREDDTVNAFLHLDMEFLGALDIYVTLKGNNVTTNFKVEDAAVLDFLQENMHLLTKKLNEDGYNVTTSLTDMKSDGGFDFVKEVLLPELPVNDVKRFRFDVKA